MSHFTNVKWLNENVICHRDVCINSFNFENVVCTHKKYNFQWSLALLGSNNTGVSFLETMSQISS